MAVRSPGGVAVEQRLFRVLAVLRIALSINLVVLVAYRWDNHDNQAGTALLVIVLVGWSALTTAWWLPRGGPAWPRPARLDLVLVLDVALALAALLLTPVLKGDFNATIPGFWIAGPVLACAIRWHVAGGVLAAAALCAADVAIRSGLDQTNYGNLLLLVIGGTVVGHLCASLVSMADERDAAQRAAAVAEERQRLARAVHDGVLQVLALVERRGAAGADDAEGWRLLGEQAALQQEQLRTMIRQQDAEDARSVSALGPAGGRPGHPATEAGAGAPRVGRGDLVLALEMLGAGRRLTVQVVGPGEPVLLEHALLDPLVAAVGACLDNVTAHVGEQASAWVLVERHRDEVGVSVRDDGPGIAAGRLEEAQAQGHLGVASSIRGRIEELGGSARLDTGAWGTEWEFRVPAPPQ